MRVAIVSSNLRLVRPEHAAASSNFCPSTFAASAPSHSSISVAYT